MAGRHLDIDTIIALSGGTLPEQQVLESAAHIANCPQCASMLAAQVEKNPTAAPDGFSDAVRRRIRLLGETQKREYYRFCIRVAAVVTLVIAGTLSTLLLPRSNPTSLYDSPPRTAMESGGLFDEPGQTDSLYSRVIGWIDKVNLPFSGGNTIDQTKK